MRYSLAMSALALAFLAADAAAEPDHGRIRAMVAEVAPTATVHSIRATPMPGVVEVVADGTILYTSEDGRFLLSGDLLDTVDRKSLTEVTRVQLRQAEIATITPSDTIRFAPKGEVRHEVFVFTDPTCGYCRRLHQQLPEYLERGIAVNYVAWPRGGEGSEPHTLAVSVWCADDPHAAMTAAKFDQPVEPRTCESHPVEQHRKLGDRLGVQGTPAIFTRDGHQLGGYVPPEQLLEQLDVLARFAAEVAARPR